MGLIYFCGFKGDGGMGGWGDGGMGGWGSLLTQNSKNEAKNSPYLPTSPPPSAQSQKRKLTLFS
jgi:hypothetical protein